MATREEEVGNPATILLHRSALVRQAEESNKIGERHIARMLDVISSMRKSTEKQRNVAMPIKNGMEHLAESVDALRHVMRASHAVLLQLLRAPAPATAKVPAISRKRPRPLVPSSPEKEAESGSQMSAPATEKSWGTVAGNKNKKKKKGKGTSKEASQKGAPKSIPKGTPTAAVETTFQQSRTAPGKPKVSATKSNTPPLKPGKSRKRRKRKWRRSPMRSVVVVQLAVGKSYAEILSTIRRQVSPEETETEFRQIRKTQGGGVLLELARCKDQRALQDAIKAAVRGAAEVRTLVPRMRVEICDLDCCTTGEEVRAATVRALDDQLKGELRVTMLAPNINEQRRAVVDAEEAVILQLIAINRIQIGWVNCRVRRWVEVPKCFRCLAYGHTKRECDGPDRSKTCWRCGKDNHKSNDCISPPHLNALR